MPPVCVTRSSPHPYTNATAGWYASRKIHILAACRAGQTRGKLSPDERAAHREQAAEHPNAEDQKRRVDAVRYLGRISKNSRAHDAAHHDHRGVKQSKLTSRLYSVCVIPSGAKFCRAGLMSDARRFTETHYKKRTLSLDITIEEAAKSSHLNAPSACKS